MTDVPEIPLNDGTTIPQVGFGVYKVPEDDTERVVSDALSVGYRSIDTAALYGNEAGVGKAIRASGIPRDDIYVTTKVWNDMQGRELAREAFERSMEELGLERLDLLLIHWPAPGNDRYVETWETFAELRETGRVTSIGVSNFEPEHLRRLMDETGVVPALNQVELHPYLAQAELRIFHELHGIATEAWGPLARGRVADDPVLQRIGAVHGRSPAQVALRWEIQLGVVTIPKSERRERMAQNLDVLDFDLTAGEMAEIEARHRDGRTGPHPRQLN
jgi:2,5-diketo-D-gluconate reductase A